MLNEDNFQYALENTRVIVEPQSRIQTFGHTSFRFYLVSELMDSVDHVRVRDGRLHADRPQILAPGHLAALMLEGFGEKAQEFARWLQDNRNHFSVLKYGFNFRKTDVVESVVHSPVLQVVDKIRAKIDADNDPLSTVIQGVDDAWEVCLLKFTIEMIQKSAGGNLGDFRRDGLF